MAAFRFALPRFLVLAFISLASIGTVSEVLANAPLGHWTFDDHTANDQSGNSRNGTILGGAIFAPSNLGQAIVLDGVDDQVVVPNAPALNPTNGITLAAWFRPASFVGTGNDPIIDKGFTSSAAPFYQYHLGVTGDQYVASPDHAQFTFSLSVNGQFTLIFTPNDTWVPGNWYHVMGTYDGSTLRLYVNGQQVTSANAPGTITSYNTDVHFGRYGNSANYLPGQIDDVRIYDHALTPTQAMELYGRASLPVMSWPALGFLMTVMLSAAAWSVRRIGISWANAS